MAHHTVFLEQVDPQAETLRLQGDEARHALRVKRVKPGERVRVLNGRGVIMETEVSRADRELELRVLERDHVEPMRPLVRVHSPAPKGPRLGDLIDALSQVGASSWTPMKTARTHAHPTTKKIRRIERVAIESAKQSQRAWRLTLSEPTDLRAALAADEPRAPSEQNKEIVVLADARGEAYTAQGVETARVLIGPEGGWTDEELDEARRAGAKVCSFGPHTMRVELAGPVAAAVILHAERAAHKNDNK